MSVESKVVAAYIWRYRLALSLMVFAVTLSFAAALWATNRASGSEIVINLAGRQRMMIERSRWECAASRAGQNPSQRPSFAALDELLGIQDRLTHDIGTAVFTPLANPVIAELLTGPEGAVATTRQLIALAPLCADQAGYDEYVRAANLALLKAESLISAYEEIASTAQRRVSVVEAVIWLIGLSVLLLEALLIFRPLRRELSASIGALEAANQTMSATLEAAGEGIIITAANGTIQLVNRAVETITGFTRDELIGKTPRVLSSGHQKKDFYTRMFDELAARGTWRGTIWNRRKSGMVFPESLSIAAVRDPSGRVGRYIAVLRDISLEVQSEEKLKRTALYDPLTGLANRALFHDRLDLVVADAQRSGSPFALAFLDLDGFKPINDVYGHLAGDKVLTQVAARLTACVRESDTLARIGGDEFAIILHRVEETENAELVERRIQDAMTEPFDLSDVRVSVGISIGWSFGPREDAVAAVIIAEADAAMYAHKRSRKRT